MVFLFLTIQAQLTYRFILDNYISGASYQKVCRFQQFVLVKLKSSMRYWPSISLLQSMYRRAQTEQHNQSSVLQYFFAKKEYANRGEEQCTDSAFSF